MKSRACSVRFGYFERAMRLPIPGGDGLTLDDAVEWYSVGVAASWLPGFEELRQVYPFREQPIAGAPIPSWQAGTTIASQVALKMHPTIRLG